MTNVFGIEISVIIVALITAYIGYQFNYRIKKREVFGLSTVNQTAFLRAAWRY